MAFTSILAVGSGAAQSADITILENESITLALKGTSGVIPLHGVVHIQAKGDDSLYYTVDTLRDSKRSAVLDAKGVYRLSRPVSSAAVGVTYEAP